MNKKVFSSVLLSSAFFSSIAFAGPKIEMEGKEYGCSKKSEELFHCESGGKKILVVKNYFGFSAYEKRGDELPSMKHITKVTDGVKVLYETPKFPGSGGSYGDGKTPLGGGILGGGFALPDTKANRLTMASGIASNLKDVQDDWAKEFVREAKTFIENEKGAKSKAKLVANGKDYSCSRGEDKSLTAEEQNVESLYGIKLQCSLYACEDSKGEKLLVNIPPAGSFSTAFILNLNGINSEFRTDDFKIFDNEKGTGIPLYDVPKIQPLAIGGMGGYGNYPGFSGLGDTDVIDQKLLIPAKFEKSPDTFGYFTNPMSDSGRKEISRFCVGNNQVAKLIEEENKVADIFKNELTTMELGHYLMMVNGQMLAVVADASKTRDLGCSYAGMILSQRAQEHLSYLQKANPKPVEKTISESEVQELFKKAKNMEDIPFGYKYDGCYARAHVMARRFEAMGIPTEKVWIKGALNVPGTDIEWNYHVAPVINVKTKSGAIVKYAIDPSLNDKAVPVDDWVASMGKNVKGGVMKTSYPFPMNIAQFQRTAVAFSSSDIYVPDNDEKRSEEQNMQMAIQTMKGYTQALKEANNEKNNSFNINF